MNITIKQKLRLSIEDAVIQMLSKEDYIKKELSLAIKYKQITEEDISQIFTKALKERI